METRENVGLILTIAELQTASEDEIIKKLTQFVDTIGYKKKIIANPQASKQIEDPQITSWKTEIAFLKEQFLSVQLSELDYKDLYILLEYIIPEENTQRPDVLFLFKDSVYSIEFKTKGKIVYDRYITQFLDYRTLITDYHQVSIEEELKVNSYLVMCECDSSNPIVWNEGVISKLSPKDIETILTKDDFHNLIKEMLKHVPMNHEEIIHWVSSRRARSMKIWEQARIIQEELIKTGTSELYSRVKTIPFSDLMPAQSIINNIIKESGKKIVFLSGVPGSGKTLIGMITLFGVLGNNKNARYYTGNEALQDVLSHALSNSSDIATLVMFKDDYIKKKKNCLEDVIIFDEAQRFWSEEKNNSKQTDAAKILSVANYTEDVTILCLISDGQRPLFGDAGIEAWIDQLRIDQSWKIYAPKNYKPKFEGIDDVDYYDELSLSVSKRQHFVDLSPWVEAVLHSNLERAKEEIKRINQNKNSNTLGITITRSLENLYKDSGSILQRIKQYNEEGSKSPYLFGLFCSQKNDWDKIKNLTSIIKRTNTFIEPKVANKWFCGMCCETNKNKIKVATETFCQGLEVDLPIIFFGGDYLFKKHEGHYFFSKEPSENAKKNHREEIYRIMEDTYRILLTRATDEMILVVPQTDDGKFDDTYNFFKEMGIKEFNPDYMKK